MVTVNAAEQLFHLICLCHSVVILDIDPRVSDPGRLINPMTAPGLPGWTEISIADFPQISKTDMSLASPHSADDIFDLGRHDNIIIDTTVK